MKPLADHGTTARAKGRPAAGIKGCPCRPCRDAENAYDKRRRYLNDTGRSRMVDAGPTQTHLKELFADHAGWTQIGAATGISSSTLVAIRHGERAEITRRVASLILAIEAADVQPPNRSVLGIGSTRRCRAVIAFGHRFKDISDNSPLDLATVRYIIGGERETLSARTAASVNAAYRVLCTRPGNSARSLNRAAQEGWAPPAAWDDESIDDPNATPDWTGYCGTDRGYWTHRLQSLPMCPPCEAAHADWLQQHAEIPGQERVRMIFAARSAASTHEADIAHDARELMRVSGLDAALAAERLGVTKQHLQQALVRHPVDVEVAA